MTITIRVGLDRAARRLAAAGIENARREARLLLAAALGRDAAWVFAHDDEALAPDQQMKFDSVVERRAARVPMAHILGRREFWGLDLEITGDVLDPRADSETLIEAALTLGFDKDAPLRILDLGTGSGCLLLALLSEWKNATGVGLDQSGAALGLAWRNAERLGFLPRVNFLRGDWAKSLSSLFDLVISNPPYIPSGEIPNLMPEVRDHEPWAALDGGPDGLDPYRLILADLGRILAVGGRAIFEIGANQANAVETLVRQHGFGLLAIHRDLAGLGRALVIARAEK